MAVGEFYTYNVWELRPGYQGRELEELTRLGIVPQYGRIKGVRAVQLFRIDEGNDAGKYLAVTIYESRDAFNQWFTSNSRDFQAWQNSLRMTLERWVEVANLTSTYRGTLILDHRFEQEEEDTPPPPPTGPRYIF